VEPTIILDTLQIEVPPVVITNRKWQLYSVLFILLKQNPRLIEDVFSQIAQAVAMRLVHLIKGSVRTYI
jgi:hypothetical protein